MKESSKISHVVRFIVDPGPAEVEGYKCNGQKILRLQGESIEALQKRCSESLTPEDDVCVLFFPIYSIARTKP